jgi:geranylgeranyl transferase type-2 subunit alpha
VLKTELAFTIPLLLESPKCYWIWSYRLWLLQQAIARLRPAVARGVWEEELGLASKMLGKDRRNFHAWGYRRHVVAQLESAALGGGTLVEPEFAYTDKMIRTDLSNFSAWHSRSRLIPRLLDERGADAKARRAFLDNGISSSHPVLRCPQIG